MFCSSGVKVRGNITVGTIITAEPHTNPRETMGYLVGIDKKIGVVLCAVFRIKMGRTIYLHMINKILMDYLEQYLASNIPRVRRTTTKNS